MVTDFGAAHITRLLASAPTDALYIDYAKLAGAEALDEVQRLANYVGVEESREQLATRIDGIFDAQLRHHENAVTELTGDVADLWEQLRTPHALTDGTSGVGRPGAANDRGSALASGCAHLPTNGRWSVDTGGERGATQEILFLGWLAHARPAESPLRLARLCLHNIAYGY